MIRRLRPLAALLALVALSLSLAGAGWAAVCERPADGGAHPAGHAAEAPTPPETPATPDDGGGGPERCPMAPAAACALAAALPAVSDAPSPAPATRALDRPVHAQPTALLLPTGLFHPPQR